MADFAGIIKIVLEGGNSALVDQYKNTEDIPSSQDLGTGDGAETSFSGTLTPLVEEGDVVIKVDGSAILASDAAGVISGTDINGNGSINYVTGEISFEINGTPGTVSVLTSTVDLTGGVDLSDGANDKYINLTIDGVEHADINLGQSATTTRASIISAINTAVGSAVAVANDSGGEFIDITGTEIGVGKDADIEDPTISPTNGVGTISSTTLGFVGATVPAITTGNYDLDITIDGGVLGQLDISIADTDDWDAIAAVIQAALRADTASTETVVISGGKIVVTSVTIGSSSVVLIEDGTLGTGDGPLLAAITGQIDAMNTTIDAPVDGLNVTSGYAEVSSTTLAFVGATVPALTNGTYDLDITSDGGALGQLNITIADSEDWDTIAASLQVALRADTSGTETVVISGGEILVTSDSTGASSTIVIADGTAATGGAVGPLLAQITSQVTDMTTAIETPVDGIDATAGIATVSSAALAFVGATVPALTNGSYDIDITSDGGALGQLTITIADSEDWDAIAASIQVALRADTSGTETVVISGGQILITSDTTGVSSTIVIADGTAGTGTIGPLLVQITGQVADMVTTIDTAVDGLDQTAVVLAIDAGGSPVNGSASTDASGAMPKIGEIVSIANERTDIADEKQGVRHIKGDFINKVKGDIVYYDYDGPSKLNDGRNISETFES